MKLHLHHQEWNLANAYEWRKKKNRLKGTDIVLFFVANIAAINTFGKDRARNEKKKIPKSSFDISF